MSEVTINVTGEMAPPPPIDTKSQLFSLNGLQFSNINATEWLTQRRQNVRPWLQFLQTSNFKMPGSVPRLSRRIMRNIEHFQSNYLFVFLGLIVYCLVTSPLLLLAVCASCFIGYKLTKWNAETPLKLFGRQLSTMQQYGLVFACSLPVYYVTGAGAALFWVLGASFFVIMLHASFYNIDHLLDQDSFESMQQV